MFIFYSFWVSRFTALLFVSNQMERTEHARYLVQYFMHCLKLTESIVFTQSEFTDMSDDTVCVCPCVCEKERGEESRVRTSWIMNVNSSEERFDSFNKSMGNYVMISVVVSTFRLKHQLSRCRCVSLCVSAWERERKVSVCLYMCTRECVWYLPYLKTTVTFPSSSGTIIQN